jgi:YfiH family protein
MTRSAIGSAATASPENPASDCGVTGVVTIDAWRHIPWLRAGFSTRESGHTTVYSHGEANEQNLGWTPEDPSFTVAENRRVFVGQFDGFSVEDLVTVRQIHSGIVRLVESHVPLRTAEGKAVLRGDGLMTIEPGLLLGVQTADCVPVLLADQRTHAVAAFHAGWRGTVARIVERGINAMRRDFGTRPADLLAAIGPAIGPCCFVVGTEVYDEFHSQFVCAPELFSEIPESATARTPGNVALGPQRYLDLWEANRRQLLTAGVPEAGITVVGECTACSMHNGRRRYFSHRAERGYTGRMLSVIGVARS